MPARAVPLTYENGLTIKQADTLSISSLRELKIKSANHLLRQPTDFFD